MGGHTKHTVSKKNPETDWRCRQKSRLLRRSDIVYNKATEIVSNLDIFIDHEPVLDWAAEVCETHH